MRNQKNRIPNNFFGDKPKRSFQPKQVADGFHVEVRDNDVMKAWRKLKKRIKEAKLIEEIKDRRYYQKPSEKKREKSKQRKRLIQKATKEAEAIRTMNVMRKR